MKDKPVINLAGFFCTFVFMKYLIIFLLFSCSTLPVHEANLIQQQKKMLQFDQKSRIEQQKIRDNRKKTLFIMIINKSKKHYI